MFFISICKLINGIINKFKKESNLNQCLNNNKVNADVDMDIDKNQNTKKK